MKKPVSFFVFLAGAFIIIVLLALPSFLMRSCKQNASSSENKQEVYIGETVINSNNVEFTVLEVKNTKKIGFSSTGGNFIAILIKIYNGGEKSWSQNPSNCTLLLNKSKFDYSTATYELSDSMSGLDDINPGISRTVSIVFETPTTTKNDRYILQLKGFSLIDDGVKIVLAQNPNK